MILKKKKISKDTIYLLYNFIKFLQLENAWDSKVFIAHKNDFERIVINNKQVKLRENL